MSLRSFVPSLLAAMIVAMAPAAAQAQIYAWKDSAGNWVLSDRQKDPSARTYAVATTPAPANLPPARVVDPEPSGMAPTLQPATFRTTRSLTQRSTQFDSLIEQNATEHGVSPHLVRAVIQQESAFNPRAVS
ncbi:MAG TPA: transglycosylase SLT domain-containing protein, partial [Vicinamibacterales bacterium]|nr:transglycosylase SLT domain-containing protein [Vicinamibacterales bacterium]